MKLGASLVKLCVITIQKYGLKLKADRLTLTFIYKCFKTRYIGMWFVVSEKNVVYRILEKIITFMISSKKKSFQKRKTRQNENALKEKSGRQ